MKRKTYNEIKTYLPQLQKELYTLIEKFENTHKCCLIYDDEEYYPSLDEIIEYIDIKD